MKWSRSGLIAIASGQIISIYSTVLNKLKNNVSKITLEVSFNIKKEDITLIEWCESPDERGFSPKDLLLIGTKEGTLIIYDVLASQKVTEFSLQHDYPVSARFSPFSKKILFVGTSGSKVLKFTLNKENDGKDIKPDWEIKTKFVPTFIETNEATEKNIFCVSKMGNFLSIVNPYSEEPTVCDERTLINGNEIVSLKLFPFWPNSILFFTKESAYLYIFDFKSLIMIFSSESAKDPIIDGFAIKENTFCIVYSAQIRIFEVDNKEITNACQTKMLNALNGFQLNAICATNYGNKVAFYTQSGAIQVIDVIDAKINHECIYRGICSKPISFDIVGTRIALACTGGYIAIADDAEKMNVSRLFNISFGEIKRLKWISDEKLAIVSREKESGQQKVFICNSTTRETFSLLKKNLEMFTEQDTKIYVSRDKKYFAVLVGNSILQIFNSQTTKLINTIMDNENICVTFNNNSNEIWTLNSQFKARKYQIVGDEVQLTRETRVSIQKETPVEILCLNGSMVVYSSNKSIKVVDWYGTKPSKGPSQMNISGFALHPSGNSCIAFCDKSDKCLNIKVDDESVATFEKNAHSIKYGCYTTNGKFFVCLLNQSHAISLYNSTITKRVRYQRLTTKDEQIDLIPLIKDKPINEVIRICNNNRCYLVADILSCSRDYAAKPGLIYVSKKRIESLLNTMTCFFREAQTPILRRCTFIISSILGDENSAFTSLVTTPPDSPFFSTNLMKASFIDSQTSKERINATVAALVSGGKIEDAIDILVATKEFKKAVRIMVTNEELFFTHIISNYLLSEEFSCEIGEKIANELLLQNKTIAAVCILITSGSYKKAYDALEGNESLSFLREAIKIQIK